MMNQHYNRESYWDDVAKQITQREDVKLIAGDDEPYYRYKRKQFLELLGSLDFSGKAVLEIGSGPGGNLDFIHSKGCKSITGVDISNEMVTLSKKLLEGKGVKVIKIDGESLPFPDDSFDTVFTSTVLQHNTDETQLRKLVKEICRVSRSEVLLFERIESKIKGHESNLGRPITYYADLLSEHGFELKETKPLPIQASYYACGAIRKLFNPASRKEGEPLTKLSITMEKLVLPFTTRLDAVVPSHRDVILLRFKQA